MVTMDEYIEQLLAEMPDSALHDVVKNILDEPIPEAVKRRLLKPLQPKKYRPTPPPRKAKARKRKAIQEELDPIPSHIKMSSWACLKNWKKSPSGGRDGRSETSCAGGKWMCPRGTHKVLTPEPFSRVWNLRSAKNSRRSSEP